jgi:predicted flap endonuclease-1-like 5' DNA nuclease
MAWSYESPKMDMADVAGRAFRLPVGAFSPLWAVFGAAASVGVAYWWMSSWTRAVTVETRPGAALKALPSPEPVAVVVESVVAAADVAEAAVDEVAETLEAVAEAAPATADDLTLLTGIGPKLSAALAERGVTRFAQIAAWTADELADFDAELALKGRASREAWVAQAKRLAS